MHKERVEHLPIESLPEFNKVRISLNNGLDLNFYPDRVIPREGDEESLCCTGIGAVMAAQSLGERPGNFEIALSHDLTVGGEFYCQPVFGPDEEPKPINPSVRNVLRYLQVGDNRQIQHLTTYSEPSSLGNKLDSVLDHKRIITVSAGVFAGLAIARWALKNR